MQAVQAGIAGGRRCLSVPPAGAGGVAPFFPQWGYDSIVGLPTASRRGL